jgi:hypothetical protein
VTHLPNPSHSIKTHSCNTGPLDFHQHFLALLGFQIARTESATQKLSIGALGPPDCMHYLQNASPCMQKDVAVKIMKIKPGAKQESLTELPYTEAAIAGICIHANIVQTMYSDLMPVLDSSSAQEGGGSFWSKAKDDRVSRSLMRSDSSVKEWQVRMVMEICDLGTLPLGGNNNV